MGNENVRPGVAWVAGGGVELGDAPASGLAVGVGVALPRADGSTDPIEADGAAGGAEALGGGAGP